MKINSYLAAALIAQYKDATVFSGHTHFKRGYAGVKSTAMYEHVHAAVCGTGWWSSVESDGCPNGYTVYRINGTEIADEYFIGTNAPMNTRSCQMRVYRGNITTGGDYVKFKWPYSSGTILINIFNGDSRWKKVEVWENGSFSGYADLMPQKNGAYDEIKAGSTYAIPSGVTNDWWAAGLDLNILNAANDSFQAGNFHMWKYVLKDPSAKVEVRATDPYGRVYTCNEIVENGLEYPSYLY